MPLGFCSQLTSYHSQETCHYERAADPHIGFLLHLEFLSLLLQSCRWVEDVQVNVVPSGVLIVIAISLNKRVRVDSRVTL